MPFDVTLNHRGYRCTLPACIVAALHAWKDTTWHNDVTASVIVPTYTGRTVEDTAEDPHWRIDVHPDEPADREYPDAPKFSAWIQNGPTGRVEFESEDPQEFAAMWRARMEADDDLVISNAIDAALCVLQNHLGVDSGDYAGMHYTGDDIERVFPIVLFDEVS